MGVVSQENVFKELQRVSCTATSNVYVCLPEPFNLFVDVLLLLLSLLCLFKLDVTAQN